MPLSRYAPLVVCTLLVAGCVTETALPESSISFSRSTCLGSCPAYSMELYSDGRYVWNGRSHVSVAGTRRGRMTADAYRLALHLTSEARIEEFRDNYEGGADCATWTTDQQTVVIGLRNSSGTKTITHYLGCEGFSRQENLLQLESALERAMNIGKFTR